MNGAERDWLPLEAVAAEPVRAAIAGAVADWSALWFAHARLTVGRVSPVIAGAAPTDAAADWQVHRAAVAISCPPAASLALARLGLAATPGEVPANSLDRELSECFARRLVGDLAQQIEQALGVPGTPQSPAGAVGDPFEGRGGLSVAIGGEAGTGSLAVAIPLHALVAFRKSAIGAPRRPRPRLEPAHKAVGAARLTVEALLGGAELSLPELRCLTPGDVIVLDRRLDEPALLFVDGFAEPVARGALGSAEGPITLTLQN